MAGRMDLYGVSEAAIHSYCRYARTGWSMNELQADELLTLCTQALTSILGAHGHNVPLQSFIYYHSYLFEE